MAMISCPECGKEVSSKAPACVSCGAPISSPAQTQNINVTVNAPKGKNYGTLTSDKSRKTAFLLCLFGGIFGLHQFYVMRIGKGFLYFFTAGLFVIGWFTDLFKILTGTYRDNVGAVLREW